MTTRVAPVHAGPEYTSEADYWLSRVFAVPFACISWIGKELLIRSQIYELRQFDDHMLRDIGVERARIAQFVRNGHRARSGGGKA